MTDDAVDKVVLAIAPVVLDLSETDKRRLEICGIKFLLSDEYELLVNIVTATHKELIENEIEPDVYSSFRELAQVLRTKSEEKGVFWRNVYNKYNQANFSFDNYVADIVDRHVYRMQILFQNIKTKDTKGYETVAADLYSDIMTILKGYNLNIRD